MSEPQEAEQKLCLVAIKGKWLNFGFMLPFVTKESSGTYLGLDRYCALQQAVTASATVDERAVCSFCLLLACSIWHVDWSSHRSPYQSIAFSFVSESIESVFAVCLNQQSLINQQSSVSAVLSGRPCSYVWSAKQTWWLCSRCFTDRICLQVFHSSERACSRTSLSHQIQEGVVVSCNSLQ